MPTIKGTDASTLGLDLTVNGATPSVELYTAEIDLTITGSYLFIGSIQPGKRFGITAFANNSKMLYTAVGGTLSVQASGSIGQNATNYDNYAPIAAISDATGFAAGAGAFRSTIGFNVTPVTTDLSGGIFVKVTTPASGAGLVLRGRIFMYGGFLPFP